MTLLVESKALLIHVAKIMEKIPNLQEVERYGNFLKLMIYRVNNCLIERETKEKYSKGKRLRSMESKTIELDLQNQNPPPGCCATCAIF